VHSSPAVGTGGTVYVGSDDNKVYALDGASGVKKWEFATGALVHSSPTIGTGGTVYVGSADKIYALDGATGAKKWEFATGGIVFSSPTIGAGGTVYVGSNDNKVYALNGAPGTTQQQGGQQKPPRGFAQQQKGTPIQWPGIVTIRNGRILRGMNLPTNRGWKWTYSKFIQSLPWDDETNLKSARLKLRSYVPLELGRPRPMPPPEIKRIRR